MRKKRIKGKKNFFGYMVVFLLVVLLCIGGYFLLFPQIHLKGGSKISVNYKSTYKERGYKASYLGKDLTKKVKVNGKVNTSKMGKYKVTYQVKGGVFSGKVVRTVIVGDIEKPKMELKKGTYYVCPGDEIVPEKFKVMDNYDGDISDKVKVNVSDKKDFITYTVQDKSGNVATLKKKVVFKDVVKPEIVLNGESEVNTFVGGEFQDPGVTVKDNCDGDLTSSVKVEGSVDTSNGGEYEITYSVSDKAGNTGSVKRKVRVSNGVIYLTFDDGPNQGTTNVILDILKEEGVKATFFVTNVGPDELIKREFDEGHTVALHTASHDYSIVYASDDAYFKDLLSVQERVKRITGIESKIVRFPGGSSNTVSRRYSSGIMTRLTKELLNRGYKYYDWNLSSGDAEGGSPTSDKIYNNVISQLRSGKVNMILMHDIKTYTRDALKRIIQYGKQKGYTFEKITLDTEMITQRVNN
ncbi:MAG: polysaccharide deacetylase family protein [Bacilli bacterium]|nr:polysaccharide deacetylase family protein [Bacilli bacterium]